MAHRRIAAAAVLVAAFGIGLSGYQLQAASADPVCPRTDQAAFKAYDQVLHNPKSDKAQRRQARELVRQAVRRDVIACQVVTS